MIDLSGGINNPLIQAGIVAGAGIIALVFRRWRTGGLAIAIALVWAYLCATPAFAFLLWSGLANQYRPRPPATYPRADAIVLVGGGTLPRPFDEWTAARDPAHTTPIGFALSLYLAGKAPIIAISAGPTGTAPLANALLRQGVAPSALLLTAKSNSTHEDALFITPLLRAEHARRILLVTYPIHLPRTVAAFRKRGFTVIAAPSHPADSDHAFSRSFRPSRAALYRSRRYLHEYGGLIWYRLRGWAVW